MASKPGVLSKWPWEPLGPFKYAVLAPFVARAIHTNLLGGNEPDNWSLHMLLATLLRLLHGQLWMSLSRVPSLSNRYRIQTKSVGFEQMDREEAWDEYLILHVLVATAVHEILPGFQHFPLFDWRGLIILTLLHLGPTEYIYYWGHRLLHHHFLYSRYHSHHHASFVTDPVTGSVHPFLEHVIYTAMFAIPLLGTWLLGHPSMAMIYFYWMGFDVLNIIGHCNVEFVPISLYRSVPLLKYLVYTPSFHSLHHSQVHTNFCLFVPLYDYLGGTVDPTSDQLHEAVRKGRIDQRPDFVFLSHPTSLLSLLHTPFGLTYSATKPMEGSNLSSSSLLMPVLTAAASIPYCLLRAFSRPFLVEDSKLGQHQLQRWFLPRVESDISPPSCHSKVNAIICQAVRDADAAGAKVISLGGMTKSFSLNEAGAALLPSLPPSLSVCIVTGDTLTAAVVGRRVRSVGRSVGSERGERGREGEQVCVFVYGADDSTVARAVAVYLAHGGLKVKLLLSDAHHLPLIQNSLPEPSRHLLVTAGSFEDAADAKIWVLGKDLLPKQHLAAAEGTHFIPCQEEPIHRMRTDIVYHPSPSAKAAGVEGMGMCEFHLPRGRIQVAHAAGLVHLLEGWKQHEVGEVEIGRIDQVFGAAVKHGFVDDDKFVQNGH